MGEGSVFQMFVGAMRMVEGEIQQNATSILPDLFGGLSCGFEVLTSVFCAQCEQHRFIHSCIRHCLERIQVLPFSTTCIL